MHTPFSLFVYRHHTLSLVFVFASNRPRIERTRTPILPRDRVARERPTHTQPHTHTERARARARPGFSGGFCVPEIFALRATVTYQRVEADG